MFVKLHALRHKNTPKAVLKHIGGELYPTRLFSVGPVDTIACQRGAPGVCCRLAFGRAKRTDIQ